MSGKMTALGDGKSSVLSHDTAPITWGHIWIPIMGPSFDYYFQDSLMQAYYYRNRYWLLQCSLLTLLHYRANLLYLENIELFISRPASLLSNLTSIRLCISTTTTQPIMNASYMWDSVLITVTPHLTLSVGSWKLTWSKMTDNKTNFTIGYWYKQELNI